MLQNKTHKCHVLVLFLAGLLASGAVLAERPSWAGNDKGDKHEQKNERKHQKSYQQGRGDEGSHDRGGDRENLRVYFGDQHRIVVHDYYERQFHSGHCPPGLAKKHNGCMPPGQAKRWHIGRPLPRDVIYYDLPPAIVVELGVPLPRHRYVRVAGDILLIAIGTGMVVDAIEDLGGR